MSLPLNAASLKDCSVGRVGTYLSINNLTFEVHCGNNIIDRNITILSAPSFQACLDACATHDGACYGVTYYIRGNECFLKDASTTITTLFEDSDFQAALTDASQLTTFNSTCPYPDGDTRQTDGGIKFQIYCDQDLPGLDYSPDDTQHLYHAKDLDDCMDWCSRRHPLCKAVSYNPDMLHGFANCYPKFDFKTANLQETPNYVTHSAVAIFDGAVDGSCSDQTTYNGPKGRSFQLSCDKGSVSGSNISSHHEDSLTKCVDLCATHEDPLCRGVVFQPSMEYGFENCYLKNASGIAVGASGTDLAILVNSTKDDEGGGGGGGAVRSPTPKHGKNKGWIAGPVVGVVAAILLVGLAWFWRRKRAHHKRSGDVAEPERKSELADDLKHSSYSASVAPPGVHHMEGSQRHELPSQPGSRHHSFNTASSPRGTTQGGSHQPVELPQETGNYGGSGSRPRNEMG